MLTPYRLKSTAPNQFLVRATGGVGFISAIDVAAGSPTRGGSIAGISLAPGSGAWSSLSDRNSKDDFAPVNGRALLVRLNSIPIKTWRYKTQPGSIRHMGPVAPGFPRRVWSR
jgi:hypothetical protein